MNYKLFLAGLVDELGKAAKEDGSEPWHPTPEDKKKDKKDERKEEPEAPPEPTPSVEEQKEASEISNLEKAFFVGLYDELEKSAGWRDLGVGRIAKMKARMGAGLKSVRGKALTSLKATGKTGTPLYSVGERRKPGGKFYEAKGGKGFRERRRGPSRRAGPKFQERVQAAIQSRKPVGPPAGERMKAWGASIKQRVTGAARGAGRQLAGAKGAIGGAVRGAAAGAAAGRAATMTPKPVRTTAAKISARPRPGRAQLPAAA